jgi:hypothetical protein
MFWGCFISSALCGGVIALLVFLCLWQVRIICVTSPIGRPHFLFARFQQQIAFS